MDMDWLLRLQRGDTDAFYTLFETYKRLVYKTAILMIQDADRAEDVLQDVFVKVFTSLGKYDPAKAALSTWIYRITVNHCLNMRRGRSFRTVPLEEAAFALARTAMPGPDEMLPDDEMLAAIGRLTAKLRAAVVLRFYLDLSYDEIGRVLDVPVGTVKSRLSAALQALRNELGDGAVLGVAGRKTSCEGVTR
jgi:RNA polymerase sigma-70 factor, ECF subfamily